MTGIKRGVIPEVAFSVQAKAPSVVASLSSPYTCQFNFAIRPIRVSLECRLGRIDPTVLASFHLGPSSYRPLSVAGFPAVNGARPGKEPSIETYIIARRLIGNVRCPFPLSPGLIPSGTPLRSPHSPDTRFPLTT